MDGLKLPSHREDVTCSGGCFDNRAVAPIAAHNHTGRSERGKSACDQICSCGYVDRRARRIRRRNSVVKRRCAWVDARRVCTIIGDDVDPRGDGRAGLAVSSDRARSTKGQLHIAGTGDAHLFVGYDRAIVRAAVVANANRYVLSTPRAAVEAGNDVGCTPKVIVTRTLEGRVQREIGAFALRSTSGLESSRRRRRTRLPPTNGELPSLRHRADHRAAGTINSHPLEQRAGSVPRCAERHTARHVAETGRRVGRCFDHRRGLVCRTVVAAPKDGPDSLILRNKRRRSERRIRAVEPER